MVKRKVRSLTAGAAALAAAGLAAGFGLAGTGTAVAASGGAPTPPWYSEYSSGQGPVGAITFYNAKGQVVTGGSITASGLGAYAVADTADPLAPHTKATLFMYTPAKGTNPLKWSGEQLGLSTKYPNTSAPKPISSTTNPVETNVDGNTDYSVQSYINTYPNTDTSTTDGYSNLYDVRLRVSGGTGGDTSEFWDTVISVSVTGATSANPGGTGGTWSVDYPQSVPPTWESKPVLSGETKVGQADKCLAVAEGATSVTYAWQANGKTISGATKSSYTIPAKLLGDKLTCSVKAANFLGSISATSPGVKVSLGSALVPVKKPVVSGPHKPGKAEKVTAGTWSPKAAKVTYQWYVGSKEIRGATKSSFTVPKSDKGKTVHVVVTASATGYASGKYTTRSVKIT
jgi:hypothetical protein